MPLSKSHHAEKGREKLGTLILYSASAAVFVFFVGSFCFFIFIISSQSVKERGTWYEQPMACSDLSFSVPSATYQCLRVLHVHQRVLLITSYIFLYKAIKDTINTDRCSAQRVFLYKNRSTDVSMHGTYLVILTTKK